MPAASRLSQIRPSDTIRPRFRADTNSTAFVFEPGNATRYELWVVETPSRFLLAWTNAPRGGKCMEIPRDMGTPHLGYIQEKMGIDAGDALALVGFIGTLLLRD